MNLIKEISSEIQKVINCEIDVENFMEIPSDINKAEYVFKAFKVAKLLNVSPEVIAKKVQKCVQLDFIDHIEVINSYVNIYIDKYKYIGCSLIEITNKDNKCCMLNASNNLYSHLRETHKDIRQLGSFALYNFICNIFNYKGYNVINLDNKHYFCMCDNNIQKYIKKIICSLKKMQMIYRENNCLCVNLKEYNNSPFIVMKDAKFTKEAMILFKAIYCIENIKDVMCICIYDECEHSIYNKVDTIIKIISEDFAYKYLFVSNYTIKILNNNYISRSVFVDINPIIFFILSHKKKHKVTIDYKFISNHMNEYFEIINCINKAIDFLDINNNCIFIGNENRIDIYSEVRFLNNYSNLLSECINKLDSSLLCDYLIKVCYNLNKTINTKKVDNSIVLLVKASLKVIRKGLLFLGIDVS